MSRMWVTRSRGFATIMCPHDPFFTPPFPYHPSALYPMHSFPLIFLLPILYYLVSPLSRLVPTMHPLWCIPLVSHTVVGAFRILCYHLFPFYATLYSDSLALFSAACSLFLQFPSYLLLASLYQLPSPTFPFPLSLSLPTLSLKRVPYSSSPYMNTELLSHTYHILLPRPFSHLYELVKYGLHYLYSFSSVAPLFSTESFLTF